MDDARYWIWLQRVMSSGTSIDGVLEAFETAEAIYNAGNDELKRSGVFTPVKLQKALDKNIDFADDIVKYCKDTGCQIITPNMPEYPRRLKASPYYPATIYVRGDVSLLQDNHIHIGVVGTRHPSQYGVDVATAMSYSVVDASGIVVSGGAKGIDSVAHVSAMDRGGKTISILGCGVDNSYLPENAPIRARIAKEGALISEYPPKTSPFSGSFVHRNMITAGLCNGVLVVEAGMRSGSLNTANTVMKFNRDLFVVSGDARGENFYGARELVKKGARVVFSGADMVSFYGCEISDKDSFYFGAYVTEMFQGSDEFPFGKGEVKEKKKRKKSAKKDKETLEMPTPELEAEDEEDAAEKRKRDYEQLSDNAKAMYDALEKSSDGMDLDAMAQATHVSITNLIRAIAELEMVSFIESKPGNKYTIK